MRKFFIGLFLLVCTWAIAQDITNHAIPIGGGPGAVGWKTGGPCTAGQTLVWSGVTSDPACGSSTAGVNSVVAGAGISVSGGSGPTTTVSLDYNALSSTGISNCTLAASVSASALTVALKNAAGADPTATSPCTVMPRSATLATGTITPLAITAATSIVVSSGSTLGTTNNTAFRIWVVVFNDAGTARLAVIVVTAGGIQYPLAEWALASSTAEGGAGAADSAGIFYTGTAVVSKAYSIAGFLTYEAGLGTVGAWSAVPTVIQNFGLGIPKPGEVIQSASVTDTTNSNTTSSSLTASTVTVTITPVSKANPVFVMYNTNIKVNANNVFAYSGITRGGTLVGVEATVYGLTSDIANGLSGAVSDFPQSTSSTTWTISFRNQDNASGVNMGSFTQTGPGSTMSATEIMG